jgi:hypothetical protein
MVSALSSARTRHHSYLRGIHEYSGFWPEIGTWRGIFHVGFYRPGAALSVRRDRQMA